MFFTFNLATLCRNGSVGVEVNIDLMLFTGTEVIYSAHRLGVGSCGKGLIKQFALA